MPGIALAQCGAFALQGDEVVDRAGLGGGRSDQEMFDVGPKRGDGAQVLLLAVGFERAGSGRRVVAEEALKNGEVRFFFAQQADVLAGARGIDRRHGDFFAGFKLDLYQSRDRHPDRVVSATGRCRRQNIVGLFGLDRRCRGAKRQGDSGAKCHDQSGQDTVSPCWFAACGFRIMPAVAAC